MILSYFGNKNLVLLYSLWRLSLHLYARRSILNTPLFSSKSFLWKTLSHKIKRTLAHFWFSVWEFNLKSAGIYFSWSIPKRNQESIIFSWLPGGNLQPDFIKQNESKHLWRSGKSKWNMRYLGQLTLIWEKMFKKTVT